ncbi:MULTISPECIES: BON domain-containing protein [Chromobacterium]|jgi:osmotically-inducible protein OsmY|uniref:BON domain-containing protein n=2 Tax=Chromobacterium TaxID=535 RepID=A0A1S1X853_9NEIS|nr:MULTISPECIES: BON domain-containing protein [Chromobacterium]MBM2885464.1 BON domain-containing protein [Chromobacterium amazonense]MDE1714163.1 BON domain-containing protein [Chromobacterium amazonense]MDQ4540887.1 BON domain-containing protein [Chromobacterium amazonense]OHX15713.1 hemolysin [Chromobacterium amazonense]POA97528.1 BON domain-containing protein [Chromobacterium sinusclupearum]
MKQTVFALLLAAGLASGLSGCVGLVAGAAAGGVLVAADRRTSGAYVDDQGIELKSGEQIASRLPSAHVNRNSFNRAVLLTGEVPTEEARQQAELIVRGIPNVRRVYNYLTVGPVSGFSERSNDTWITSKVRTRLLDGKGYNPNDVKVVTERGVVYMLGLVTQAEGQIAAKVVSETAGVQKVVTLFEYIQDVTPAK